MPAAQDIRHIIIMKKDMGRGIFKNPPALIKNALSLFHLFYPVANRFIKVFYFSLVRLFHVF